MNFQPLDTKEQLEKIAESRGATIIFKHNTTCPISKSVIKKLEQDVSLLPKNIPVYVLDLLSNRIISDSVAETFGVQHESPQLLLIKGGSCIYNKSLYSISAEQTTQALEEKNN